jgi:hypothetical protein
LGQAVEAEVAAWLRARAIPPAAAAKNTILLVTKDLQLMIMMIANVCFDEVAASAMAYASRYTGLIA